MSSIDQKQLEKVARLARLTLTPEQLANQAEQFERLLDFVDTVKEADLGQTEPMAHPLDAVQRLRDDRVTEVDQSSEFQSQAPDISEGLYRVPKVIE